jgi:hypothetical protein
MATAPQAPSHPPLDEQADIGFLERGPGTMKIRDIIVAMYRAAGHVDVWDYADVERLGNADPYRKLILSMLHTGTLVRTHDSRAATCDSYAYTTCRGACGALATPSARRARWARWASRATSHGTPDSGEG